MITSLLWVSVTWAYSLNGRQWEKDYPTEESFELNADSFAEQLVESTVIEDRYLLAIDIWNTQSEAILHLPYGGLTDDLEHGGGNNDQNTTLYIAYYEGTALAKARHNAIDGALTDCDIAFYGTNLNGAIPWSFDDDEAPEGYYDFTHTVVHELGHCIGIAHSEDEDAIMYGSSTKGSGWEKRNLHPDDIEAAQALYGVAEVLVYIDSWWLEDADGDGKVGPGEVAELVVQLGTESTAHTYDLVGSLDAQHSAVTWSNTERSLGDLAPPSSDETQPPTMRFEFQAVEDCDPSPTIPFELTITDMSGILVTEQGDFSLSCPTDLAQPPATGCSCGGRANRWTHQWNRLALTGLFGLIILTRRRDPLEQR